MFHICAEKRKPAYYFLEDSIESVHPEAKKKFEEEYKNTDWFDRKSIKALLKRYFSKFDDKKDDVIPVFKTFLESL